MNLYKMTRRHSLHLRSGIIFFTIFLTVCSQPGRRDKIRTAGPEELYGQLFYDVQSRGIFRDGKTFVDCIPRYGYHKILADYSKVGDKSDSALSAFVSNHFYIPANSSGYITDSSSINRHIAALWDVLKRPADKEMPGTLIPLPFPYIEPGGRFREIYYWDSYFTMLGLQADHRNDMIKNMIDNFSYLIDLYGFIPNGNRTYYLSRSQPPFYSMMLTVLARSENYFVFPEYLEYLEKEYAFWMNGIDSVNKNRCCINHVVMLADGDILNRYWDEKSTPRPESYREDTRTADEAVLKLKNCRREELFRNIRAAAESGWDFSSRWLSADNEKNYSLYTIHTTDIIPVDLNSLLYYLEYVLSETYNFKRNTHKATYYRNKYEARRKAMMDHCWNREKGFFADFNIRTGKQTAILSLAGVYPLFFSIADKGQAELVAATIQKQFIKPGGVVTTLNNTGQQWDSPNGWAPLQWITIQGLRNYGYDSLASEIKERWLELNKKVYRSTYKMVEKYNVVDLSLKVGGGEYPNQDGFGWTNGVYQKLSEERPEAGTDSVQVGTAIVNRLIEYVH